MIISKEFVKEIDRFVADEALVVGINERVPGLSRVAREYFIILRVELDVVLIQVLKELLGSQYLGDLHQLI
jgi:hypothetical protein